MEKLKFEELQDRVVRLVKRVIDKRHTGLIIVGPGGLGKSYCVARAFEEEGISAGGCFNSYTTPLGLYHLLFQFKDRTSPPLVLDDMEKIYRDTVVVSLLRAATWGLHGKDRRMVRRVNWISTSAALERLDLPSGFTFHGRVIMLGNSFPEKSDYFDALITRVPNVSFDIAKEEIFLFMRKIVAKGWRFHDEKADVMRTIPQKECALVVSYLEEKGIANLRFLEQGLITYFYDREDEEWKHLIDLTSRGLIAKTVSLEDVVKELVALRDLEDNERIKLFQERTGRSRATYFRIKRRLGFVGAVPTP